MPPIANYPQVEIKLPPEADMKKVNPLELNDSQWMASVIVALVGIL